MERLLTIHFLLNELELIEPALYLDRWEEATERFVDVLKSKILNKCIKKPYFYSKVFHLND